MTTAGTGTMELVDLLKWRNEQRRAGKYIALGRVRTVAIGPVPNFTPPPNDPYIKRRGRMMDFANQFLPIAQPEDKEQIIVTAPMVRSDGVVGLPDLADPEWRAPDWTEEEVQDPDSRDPAKDRVALVPQRLQDRTSEMLNNSNFLVFRPVLSITYQPEDLEGKKQSSFRPEEWGIVWGPDFQGKHCTMLVDEKTGETHFLFGIPKLVGNVLKAGQV